jgi:hypothetical protein
MMKGCSCGSFRKAEKQRTQRRENEKSLPRFPQNEFLSLLSYEVRNPCFTVREERETLKKRDLLSNFWRERRSDGAGGEVNTENLT